MRFYKYLVRPPDGLFHPSEEDLMPDIAATREAIVQIRRLDDERGTVLYRASGDPTGLDVVLDRHDDILTHEIIDRAGDRFYLYTQFRLGDPTQTMLELADAHGFLLETPFRFTEDDALELTLAGIEEEMQDAVPSFIDAADDVDVALEEVRDYVPEEDLLASLLTERQRAIVEAAVERGYYRTPREVTHRDLAEAIDCSPSTAGEHLQKAENKIVPRAVR